MIELCILIEALASGCLYTQTLGATERLSILLNENFNRNSKFDRRTLSRSVVGV
jgi:hypothetical protein